MKSVLFPWDPCRVLAFQKLVMRWTSSSLLAVLLTLALCGCGGGYRTNTSPIVVAVKASATMIDQSQQLSLIATVTNAPGNDSSGVNWGTPSCSASACGTLTNMTSTGATYKPPATIPLTLTVTVAATSVKDPTQSGSATFIVAPDPVVSTSVATTPAAIGSAYSLQLISGGAPPYTLQFSAAGSISATSIPAMQFSAVPGAANGGSCTGLPDWLSFNQNTGVLSAPKGVPESATDFACALTVKDSLGITSPGVTVRILVPIIIKTTQLPGTEQTQSSYRTTLEARGGSGVYSWNVLGSLPSGLSLDSSAGIISGNVGPSASTQNFKIQVAGSTNDTPVAQDFTIAVSPRLAVATQSASDLTFNIGVGNHSIPLQTVAGTGVGSFHWKAASPLPSWLNLSDSGVLSASAVPNAATTSQVTVQVTDDLNLVATAPLNITIPIVITTASLPSAEQLQPSYTETLKAGGGTGIYSWSLDGSLPAGLNLDSNTGVISGVVATSASTQTFAIQAKDSTGASGSKQYTIAINPQLAVVPPSAPSLSASIKSNYSLSLQISSGTGVAPFTWGDAPGSTRPSWLNLSTSGVLAAAQVPDTATTQSFTVQVTDAANVVATLPLTISIPIIITTAELPTAIQSHGNYTVQVSAGGGTGTYSFRTVAGSLPTGLDLNPNTGLISGTVGANAVTQTFVIEVSDSNHATGSKQFTIAVNQAVVVTTTSLPNGAVNSPYSQQLSATGGVPPYSNWQVVSGSGSPPANVFLDATTGIISSGTDTVGCPAGTFKFSVTVQDSLNNASAPQPLSITTTTTTLSITTTSIPSYSTGLTYSQQLQSSGSACGTTVTWSLASGSGPLPGWLTLSPGGLLSGTPGPNDSGSVDFEVQATDGTVTKSQALTLGFSGIFTVSGKVSLVNGGGPLSGATVRLGQNLTATTDSNGIFSIRTGNGTYTATLSLTGPSSPSSLFIPASSSITSTNGDFKIT